MPSHAMTFTRKDGFAATRAIQTLAAAPRRTASGPVGPRAHASGTTVLVKPVCSGPKVTRGQRGQIRDSESDLPSKQGTTPAQDISLNTNYTYRSILLNS